jgi:hypothetical protein
VVSAAGRVIEREQQGRAWMAWHVAALPRLKKFPTLESLMGVKRVIRQQSPEEMEAVFARMNRRL